MGVYDSGGATSNMCNNNFTKLDIDVGGGDFRGDLMNYLQNSGIRLFVLELRKMALPVDMSQLCQLCPNLKRLKVINNLRYNFRMSRRFPRYLYTFLNYTFSPFSGSFNRILVW